jgi:hypothetical protein
MRKRAAAWACRAVSYQVNWKTQTPDQAAGFLRDDPI